MKYKIIVDYGKPFEICCDTKKALFGELKKIKQSYYNNEGDCPYCDTLVYLIKGDYEVDITEDIFKEFEK